MSSSSFCYSKMFSRVLEENSRGNPGWCESYLSALLSSHGLRVEMMTMSEMRSRTFCIPDIALLTFCQCRRHLSSSTLSSVVTARSGTESQRRSEDDISGGSSRESLEEDPEVSDDGEGTLEEHARSEPRSKEARGESLRCFRSLLQTWRALWKDSDSPIDHDQDLGPDIGKYRLKTRSGRCSACSMEDDNKVSRVVLLPSSNGLGISGPL